MRGKIVVSVRFLVVALLIGLIAASVGIVSAVHLDGLVGYWAAEDNANDASGHGNHGTLKFGATFDVGQVGQAFRFDGVDDHVEVPDDPTLDIPGPLTVAAWINSDVIGATQYIVIKDSETDLGKFHNYQLSLIHDGTIWFIVGDGTTPGFYDLRSTTALTAGTWYHVAAAYDGTNLIIYINGEQDAIRNIGSKTLFTNAGPLRIGRIKESGRYFYPFDGLIDEVRVYSSALSESDIGALVGNPSPIEVSIDIKPGSNINPINLGSKGVIPVAIFTTSVADGDSVDFNAADVDQSSLELSGAAALTRGKSGKVGSFEDVDGDGDLDLVAHFPTADLSLTAADAEAVLEGLTLDGTPITGSDSIVIVP